MFNSFSVELRTSAASSRRTPATLSKTAIALATACQTRRRSTTLSWRTHSSSQQPMVSCSQYVFVLMIYAFSGHLNGIYFPVRTVSYASPRQSGKRCIGILPLVSCLQKPAFATVRTLVSSMRMLSVTIYPRQLLPFCAPWYVTIFDRCTV